LLSLLKPNVSCRSGLLASVKALLNFVNRPLVPPLLRLKLVHLPKVKPFVKPLKPVVRPVRRLNGWLVSLPKRRLLEWLVLLLAVLVLLVLLLKVSLLVILLMVLCLPL
jgi:hypothetical protein